MKNTSFFAVLIVVFALFSSQKTGFCGESGVDEKPIIIWRGQEAVPEIDDRPRITPKTPERALPKTTQIEKPEPISPAPVELRQTPPAPSPRESAWPIVKPATPTVAARKTIDRRISAPTCGQIDATATAPYEVHVKATPIKPASLTITYCAMMRIGTDGKPIVERRTKKRFFGLW